MFVPNQQHIYFQGSSNLDFSWGTRAKIISHLYLLQTGHVWIERLCKVCFLCIMLFFRVT